MIWQVCKKICFFLFFKVILALYIFFYFPSSLIGTILFWTTHKGRIICFENMFVLKNKSAAFTLTGKLFFPFFCSMLLRYLLIPKTSFCNFFQSCGFSLFIYHLFYILYILSFRLQFMYKIYHFFVLKYEFSLTVFCKKQML